MTENDYEKRVQQEIEIYTRLLSGKRVQDCPDVWGKVEEHFQKKIKNIVGVNGLFEYVGKYVKGKKTISMLGLGSGPCGVEIDTIICGSVRPNGCEDVQLTCIDINESLLKQAQQKAAENNIRFTPLVQDINKMSLEENSYDVIVAYASLHHFLKLDHITQEINKALKDDGIFVTVDIPTRKGCMMWDETFEIVRSIWRTLPPKFKIDHTKTITPVYIEEYENTDFSLNSFECINSEAIIPSLRKNMKEIVYVPAFSLARRFFDTKFGPNFDLRQQLDESIFRFIMELDEYFLENNILKPETFFGVYVKR